MNYTARERERSAAWKDLDIQVADVQGVVFDEDPTRLNHVSHEDVEHATGLQGVVVVEFHLEEAAALGIHRGLVEFLGVHFTKTLESLDLDAAAADFLHDLEDARDGEDLVSGLSVDEVEERGLAVGVVLDLEALLGQFGDELLDALGLVDFHEAGAAAAGVLVGLGRDLLTFAILTLGGFGIEKVEVDVLGREVAQLGLVVEVLDAFVVTVTDDDEIRGKSPLGGAGVQVGFEFTAKATDRLARFLETVEQFKDLLEGCRGDLLLVGERDELEFLGAERDEDAIELNVVIDVLLTLLALDLVKRGLRDEDVTAADELRHLVVEEGQEQSPDVGAVDVGIGHDDDAAVAELLDVEGSLLIAVTDAGADGRDHGLDLGILEDLVEAGLLDVDQLSADREDRLEAAVTALLGATTCRVTLDDVELGEGGIALGAVGQLAGESATGEGALADGLAGLARCLAGTCGGEGLLDDLLGDRRVLIEVIHEPLVDRGVHDTLDLGVDQLDLGLGLEAWVGELDAQDGGEALADVVAGEGRILLLQEIVGLGVLVDRAGERCAQTGEVSAAVRIRNRVREAEDLVGVGVVVLEDGVDEDFVALAGDDDRLGMEDGAGLAELANELLDAVLVEEGLRAGAVLLVIALVGEDDLDAGVEEGEFAETSGETLELESRRDREDLRIGQEGDEGSGLLLILEFAEDGQRLGCLALSEGHEVDLPLAHDLDLEPGGEGVDALGTDAVETARVLVRPLAELTAGMQVGQNEFEGRDLELGMDLNGNASAIIADRDRSIGVNRHLDARAVARQMFVDRVIEHLKDAVVQTPLIGIADVHAGAFANRLKALQFVDLGSSVFLTTRGILLFGDIGVV